MNKERLRKEYKWLFEKKMFIVNAGKKVFYKKIFDPIIEDAGSHWRVYREKNSSPLILSKNYV